MSRTPYKLNVPGDFYVENGECVACMLPAGESPNLIGEDEDSEYGYHCYFKKQPDSENEVHDAINAMVVSCCEALRYKGKNETTIKLIIDAGEGSQIDGHVEASSNNGSTPSNSLFDKLKSIIERFR